jgi:hypothetical protein
MIGRTVTWVSALIIVLLVAAATYVVIGGSSAHTAVTRVAIDDLVVRWPHHDAAIETGTTRLRSQDARVVAIEATDDGVVESVSTELPQNQTIFDVVVEASDDANSIAAANAVADWLVTDSLERRRGPREERVAEFEAKLVELHKSEGEAEAALQIASTESERIVGQAELGTATTNVSRTEKALAELDDELALVESQFLVVGTATAEEPSNARTATALAAGLSAGFLFIAAAEFVRTRRSRDALESDDG